MGVHSRDSTCKIRFIDLCFEKILLGLYDTERTNENFKISLKPC